MKKVCLILGLALAASLSAQRIGKTLIHMEQLYRNGSVLQAMDSAAYVLSIDNDNLAAKTFMYQHWDKTMKTVQERLSGLTDENSFREAKERLLIYKQLDEIHSYLRTVPMPFYGPNNRWVWQPEVGYYAGMYDTERMKIYPFVLALAEDALRSYDVELARTYYDFARQELFVSDGERTSNEVTMLKAVNHRIDSLAQTSKVYEAIVAYDMIGLSLWLDATQAERETQKLTVQQHISDLYLQLAQEYEAQGDTIAAQEHRLMAEDWKVYNDTVK